jgi:hypothetical protein
MRADVTREALARTELKQELGEFLEHTKTGRSHWWWDTRGCG